MELFELFVQLKQQVFNVEDTDYVNEKVLTDRDLDLTFLETHNFWFKGGSMATGGSIQSLGSLLLDVDQFEVPDFQRNYS